MPASRQAGGGGQCKAANSQRSLINGYASTAVARGCVSQKNSNNAILMRTACRHTGSALSRMATGAGMGVLLALLLSCPDGADGRRKKNIATKPAEPAPGLPPVVQQHAGAAAGRSESQLYSTGTQQLNENRLQEALASFDSAVAASPTGGRTSTRVNRGLTLQRLGRFDDALASYNGALGLPPPPRACPALPA